MFNKKKTDEWRSSILIPIYKNKGDVQSCNNYRGIKLMSHTMKIMERVLEKRLREEVNIGDQQFGFMPKKSTIDAIFALRINAEQYRSAQKELHCVFIDLEKAYDRVPRDEVWHSLAEKGVSQKYITLIKNMYHGSETVVRTAAGTTEPFTVEVGIHQGSALSPFLFAIVMDQLTEGLRRPNPWTMMFADDIALLNESGEEAEEELESWREAMERRGLRVSRTKTEYMCLNKQTEGHEIKLKGQQVPETTEFKYLGSTVQGNGDCDADVNRKIQSGWNSWRKLTGLMCDKRVPVKVKGKLHKTVVRPAMMYGLETLPMT